jgi:NAD(P)-dependent dehydrogenase (short-subunit alcohol dehydrogenase family)
MTKRIADLGGKVALVTGGSRGLGKAMALGLAQAGANVAIVSRKLEACETLAGELRALGVRANAYACHVGRWDSLSPLVESVCADFGKIDILINNAGVSGSDPDRLSIATWDRQMSINAKGVFLGMRAVIPVMQKAKGGSIVNTSSISGVVGQTFVHMGYNASKGAVRTMSKAAAVQFARDGIRVNSVHPGLMPAMRTSVMSADPTVRAAMLKAIPMRREGRVDEVANANLFLASDEASYITGIEVPVDGGYLAM